MYRVLCLLLVITLWFPSVAQAQRVTVLFDVSGSISDPMETTPLEKERTSPQSREYVMISLLAEIYARSEAPIEVIPWNTFAHPSFLLMAPNQDEVKMLMWVGLPPRGDMTYLGTALESVIEESVCSIYVVLTDGLPDNLGFASNVIPRFVETSPLGIFVLDVDGGAYAVKYFSYLLSSPNYTAETMSVEGILNFISEMLDGTKGCPSA